MQPDLRLYLGKSHSGKTTLALHQARTARRLLVHDPVGDDRWGLQWTVTSDRAELLDTLAQPGAVRCAWRGAFTANSERERLAAFEWANRCAWACGNLTILWDELDTFTERGLPPVAYRIVNAGRHRALAVYACSRRPFRVPRDVSANAGRIICFRMTEPRDVQYLEAIAGDVARQVPQLWRFHALDWTEYGSIVRVAPFD